MAGDGKVPESKGEVAELLSGGRGLAIEVVQLPLFNYVHLFDLSIDLGRRPKALKPLHRPELALGGPVVLLDEVVEVLGLAQLNGLGGLSGYDALTSQATNYRFHLCCT